MPDLWDAVVIGAGPAGAVAARELARRGVRVLLVDRAAFPRTKVCGCCLNGAALAALARLGLGRLAESGVPLTSVKLGAGGASATVNLATGVALARSELDHALVKEAQAAGAAFHDGTTAKAESRSDESISICLNESQVTAKIVVVASGLSAQARVQAGSRIGGGVILEKAPEHYSRGTIFMATAPGGYVGLVRLADESLDVAAAFDPEFVRTEGGLGPAAVAILKRTGWPAIPELADLSWKGTPALTRRRGAVAERRIFAVGDAAGYVEPFTGEGMAWAIASAAALAPIAARASADWNDAYIDQWKREQARIVGRRQWVCRAAARVLRSPALTGVVVRALAAMPMLARPVVSFLNRPVHSHGRLA